MVPCGEAGHTRPCTRSNRLRKAGRGDRPRQVIGQSRPPSPLPPFLEGVLSPGRSPAGPGSEGTTTQPGKEVPALIRLIFQQDEAGRELAN